MLCLNAGHTKLSNRLMRESWVDAEPSQVGDDGTNAVFHVDEIEKAAEYAKLHIRQKISDEERERRAERMRTLNSAHENLGFSTQLGDVRQNATM